MMVDFKPQMCHGAYLQIKQQNDPPAPPGELINVGTIMHNKRLIMMDNIYLDTFDLVTYNLFYNWKYNLQDDDMEGTRKHWQKKK